MASAAYRRRSHHPEHPQDRVDHQLWLHAGQRSPGRRCPRRYKVKVLAPRRVGAGKNARVKIKLPKAARRALKKQRNAKVKIKLTLTGGGKKTTKTVRITINAKGKK